MSETKREDDLVPVDRVLDDMYNDYSPVQTAARDYYYQHYATPEERKRMDRENKISSIVAGIIWGAAVLGAVYAIIVDLI